MIRQILIASLLVVAWAGLANGQETAGTKREIVKYPVPGSQDAVAEPETKLERDILDDFYQSKVEETLHQAALTNDAAKFDRLLADQVTWTTERFGRGITLTKAQVLADFRSGTLHVDTHTHDHVRLVAFGSTVLVSGMSTSTLHYRGKVSNGPRMSLQAWTKLDGRWQMIAHHVSDISGPVLDHVEPNQFTK